MTRKTGKPQGKTVSKQTVCDGRQTIKAKTETRTKAKTEKGACGARIGSRKEQIARVLLDTNSIPKALAKAVELDVKPGTVKSWAGTWRRAGLWTPPADTPADTKANAEGK